jgi:thiamine-phosphate pyrophosphorylase
VARDHDASAAALTDFAALLMAEAHAHEAALIVAGRPDLAAGLGAHGVQLRAQDLSPADARLVLTSGWIGRSVHSAVEGAEAAEAGADYLVAGNIWETPSHPNRPAAGIGLIEALVSLGKPVFAIGGVTAERARQVQGAGAWGVASIRALWGARKPADAAEALLEAWV